MKTKWTLLICMTRHLACLLFVVLNAAPLWAGPDRFEPHDTVTRILTQIQQKYNVTDFEADFTQESYLEAMDVVDTAQGHVLFRPPTQMRWHYQTPEEYVLVMNREHIWLYWPADNQVMIGKPEEYLGHAGMKSFFSQPAALLERFHVTMAEKRFGREEVYSLRLIPKDPQPNIKEAFLLISTKTFCIVESIIYNAFGDETRIRFSNIEFNQDIDPSLFDFVAPEDAQILQLTPGQP